MAFRLQSAEGDHRVGPVLQVNPRFHELTGGHRLDQRGGQASEGHIPDLLKARRGVPLPFGMLHHGGQETGFRVLKEGREIDHFGLRQQ
jgi:hypothetical protein